MPSLVDVTAVLGGGCIYRRQAGGPWHFDLWVEGEGRIRKSLKTTDKSLVLRSGVGKWVVRLGQER